MVKPYTLHLHCNIQCVSYIVKTLTNIISQISDEVEIIVVSDAFRCGIQIIRDNAESKYVESMDRERF